MATVEAATNTLTCIHFLKDVHIIFKLYVRLLQFGRKNTTNKGFSASFKNVL